MKSITAKLKRVRDILESTDAEGKVFHYEKEKEITAPWIVWTENGEEGSFEANNQKECQQLTGTIDLYTQTEYDPIIDQIQNALNSASDVGWTLLSVQYEDQTKLIHYEWSFTIS